MQDSDLVKEVQKIMDVELGGDFMITQDGMLVMKDRICVPNVNDLKRAIMEEAYCLFTPCILIVSRCTEPSRKYIGGQV